MANYVEISKMCVFAMLMLFVFVLFVFEPANEKMYLSNRWPAKAQVSLGISAVSPEPFLLADMY